MANKIDGLVYSSRDRIRKQIIDFFKEQNEIENIDWVKSNFLAYFTNIISVLISNLNFYSTSAYREFYLTKALSSDNIRNLALLLGYSPKPASKARAKVLFSVPFMFSRSSISFVIPEKHKFYASNVEFLSMYSCRITVTNNNTASIQVHDQNRIYSIPVRYSTNSETGVKYFHFLVDVEQVRETVHEFQVEEKIQTYEFWSISVPLTDQASRIEVSIIPPGSSTPEIYTEFYSLFLMSPYDRGYVVRRSGNNLKIYFGNSLLGQQPQPGSTVRVTVEETMGSAGNVIAGSIKSCDRIFVQDPVTQELQLLEFSITNPFPASGGEDAELPEITRRQAIDSITELSRLVTNLDFENMPSLLEDFPFSDSYVIAKTTPIHRNSVFCYLSSTCNYVDGTSSDSAWLPLRSVQIDITSKPSSLSQGSQIVALDDNDEYILPFDLSFDYVNGCCEYSYKVTDIEIELSPDSMQNFYPQEYALSVSKIHISRNQDGTVVIDAMYDTTEPTFNQTTATLFVKEWNKTLGSINFAGDKKFTILTPHYSYFPDGNLHFQLSIYLQGTQKLFTYSWDCIITMNLKTMMLSPIISPPPSPSLKDPVYNTQAKTVTLFWDPILDSKSKVSYCIYLSDSTSVSPQNYLSKYENIEETSVTIPLVPLVERYALITSKTPQNGETDLAVTPAQPTRLFLGLGRVENLQASVQVSDGSISLSWNPVLGASLYKVQVAEDPDFQTALNTYFIPDTSYIVRNKVKPQYIRVCAIYGQYIGEYSDTILVDPFQCNNFHLAQLSDMSATVSWQPTSVADGGVFFWLNYYAPQAKDQEDIVSFSLQSAKYAFIEDAGNLASGQETITPSFADPTYYSEIGRGRKQFVLGLSRETIRMVLSQNILVLDLDMLYTKFVHPGIQSSSSWNFTTYNLYTQSKTGTLASSGGTRYGLAATNKTYSDIVLLLGGSSDSSGTVSTTTGQKLNSNYVVSSGYPLLTATTKWAAAQMYSPGTNEIGFHCGGVGGSGTTTLSNISKIGIWSSSTAFGNLCLGARAGHAIACNFDYDSNPSFYILGGVSSVSPNLLYLSTCEKFVNNYTSVQQMGSLSLACITRSMSNRFSSYLLGALTGSSSWTYSYMDEISFATGEIASGLLQLSFLSSSQPYGLGAVSSSQASRSLDKGCGMVRKPVGTSNYVSSVFTIDFSSGSLTQQIADLDIDITGSLNPDACSM